MKTFNFKKLLGKKISILITGLNKMESYVGIVEEVEEDHLILDTVLKDNPAYTISSVILELDLIKVGNHGFPGLARLTPCKYEVVLKRWKPVQLPYNAKR